VSVWGGGGGGGGGGGERVPFLKGPKSCMYRGRWIGR